jgi:tetratricopeptide (TPR) repeat protein
MPKSGTGDIPHVTVHDHYISKPNKKVEDKTAEIVFRGLRCINNPASSNHSWATAWLNAFEQFGNHKHTLDSAGLYIDKLTKVQQLPYKVRQLFLLNKYSDIYILKIDIKSIKDAWSAYRIGEASSVMQDYIQAEKYYNKAVSLAPKNLEFREKLASIYILNNKYTEALKELNMLISFQPKLAMAWSNKGYILKTQNKFDEAMKCFEQALALEPDYIKALENYIDLCHMQNKNKDMQKAISRLLKLQPNHPIKSLLSTLK